MGKKTRLAEQQATGNGRRHMRSERRKYTRFLAEEDGYAALGANLPKSVNSKTSVSVVWPSNILVAPKIVSRIPQ